MFKELRSFAAFPENQEVIGQQDDAHYWCIVERILPGEVKPQDAVKTFSRNSWKILIESVEN